MTATNLDAEVRPRAGRADQDARGEPGRGARCASRGDRAGQSEAQRHRDAGGGSGAGRGARRRGRGDARRCARPAARPADRRSRTSRSPPASAPPSARRCIKDNVPAEDAEVVRRLKAAGAIVLAKTNTPEFATGANTVNAVFGATRNPWNPALSPAGSSGGSAVAVATGMVPLAQGTDFGCSIRIPAAFCGIVGIRPTPGLTPNHPMPLAWDPGQVHGPLARTAEDAALMLDAMVGFSRLSPISVAPPWQSALAAVERCEDCARAAHRLCVRHRRHRRRCRDRCDLPAGRARLAQAGATVEEIAFDVSDGRDPYQTWRGAWMVGQQFARLAQLEAVRRQPEGQREGRAEGHRARSRRRRADAPRGVSPLPRAVRALRPAAHAGGAGEALSGRDELSRARSTAASSRTTSTGSRRRF